MLEVLGDLIARGVSDIFCYADKPLYYKIQDHLYQGRILTQQILLDFLVQHTDKSLIHAVNEGDERDFSFSYQKYFCRVHVFLSEGSIAVFLRILPQEVLSLFENKIFDSFKKVLENEKGLILVVGATGSGKTTMANAVLDYLNSSFVKHIVCIEDPIEYRHVNKKSCFTYREVGKDTKSFEKGIVSAMRQNPDVIFIGELRDKKSIQTALFAAHTGHVVLATMHARNSVGAISRLLNVFEDKMRTIEVAESLVGIIAQQKQNLEFDCEILLNTLAIKNLIKEEKLHQIPSVMALAQNQGMKVFKNKD
ncbi:type IV pilus twitching motility protein PilT [Helicobacter anatolicus]|uniref:type IV pilus twitching motility protein PilT n=1 Tax=Helicobacter anatolicus TaxID=2905874 RepID=UPI001E3642E6|nr:ATPase, T2SS/T4P/T4SS family [Helicobacter anatolicus]MCE3038806.1 Flp pilus assembly complex ATPase component TadA [Helicobacter anatolicus]